MGDHLVYFMGLLAAAASFALFEIQVEGPAGWAANLPTWRVKNRWWERFFPGRPLTGYHFWTLAFIAVVAHLPFAFNLPWTWRGELRSVAFILFFWVVEDFLWFVLNPHYGLRRFRPELIAWHQKTWWWVAPRDYWVATAIAVALYVVSRQPPQEYYVAMRP
ncbi:hypothetical protein RAS1_10620 [Phycisphaerae bacterium RAS1]|nr:hypothetical protein RAS1_10620 [Phycisphaerae bacterium RAS1]